MYQDAPDGYCGDEDNGQTSAWYVFSAMGFYPVCPATNQYVLGAPLFKKILLHLENGKKFVIHASNNNAENKFIQNVFCNDKEHDFNWIDHNTIMNGGHIEFQMGSQANLKRGTATKAYPFSLSRQK